MKKPLIVTILLSVLVAPAAVWAKDNTKARAKAAKKACASGDYRRGVEILSDLYVDTDNVTFIYNQARCYEQNHQWVGAIDRFREYLRKTSGASSSERADAEKHLAECEAFRSQEEAKQAPSVVLVPPPQPIAIPAPAPQPPPPSPSPPPVAQASEVAETPAVRDESRGGGLRVAGIVLGSVGVAAAAAGLVLNLKANSLANDYNKNPSSSTRSSQSSYKKGALIGYGVGAGALVTGIVLFIIGHSSGEETSTKVSLLPLLTPTEMSLGVRGAF